MKVLIIEDDVDIAGQLAKHLRSSGFITRIEADGNEGYFKTTTESYDAILLDLGLPGRDGLSILQNLRRENIDIPVIVITARSSQQEIINGLDAGADDYVCKPFDFAEVSARLRTNIRRSKGQQAQILKSCDITLDLRSGHVSQNGALVRLTRIEHLIVQYLFLNQARPVSITELSEHVYDDYDHDSSIIPRHIANIRKKLGSEFIQTESNRGYCVPQDPI